VRDAQVVEEGLHADAEGLVVAVDGCAGGGFAAAAGAADAGQDGRDDVIAEGEQAGDSAGRAGRDVVAAGAAGLDGEVLATQFGLLIIFMMPGPSG
jgi:phage terminase large subunit-like protein